MKTTDTMLVCPVPFALVEELDTEAAAAGLDRAALVRSLLAEALRTRAIARLVERRILADSHTATIIPFPPPPWAAEVADGD